MIHSRNKDNPTYTRFENKKYIATPDLTMAQTYTIPRWNWYPGKVQADLYSTESFIYPGGPNTRSRIAQSGIVANTWHQIKNNLYRGILQNYSARDIVLTEGFGFGPLFKPSTALIGEELVEKVRAGVDIDPKHLFFSSVMGTIVPALSLRSEQVPMISAFGIKVNTQKMWQVDPEPDEPVIINSNLPTRQSVNEFLVPVTDNVTSTPFVVTTTMPANIHGFEATVLTNRYGPLKHSPSVIHFPSPDYNWNGENGNSEGIRLELVSSDKYWISRNDLINDIPVAFFTAH